MVPASASSVLPMRRRQAGPAPQPPQPAADESGSADVSAEELGAIFGAFQRGLDRGRNSEQPHDGEGER